MAAVYLWFQRIQEFRFIYSYICPALVFLLNPKSHPRCGFSRLVQPDTQNTRHISSLPIQQSASQPSHWSEYRSGAFWLAVRRVLLAIRSRQTSHTKKPQSAANIPLLTQLRMESFQLIRIPQSISWHLTEYGTKCPFCIPKWEKYMMWWWWCFLSSIWGKPQLIHSWPQEEEENEIVFCDWLWVIGKKYGSRTCGG